MFYDKIKTDNEKYLGKLVNDLIKEKAGKGSVKNSELFPFNRNRYYKGKMLTSADFEAEQLYMNNKRRFMNQILGGSGIVCGLSVISLDDLSIMIESGVAIDDAGREIVVENSVVKKLSTLEGFESLRTNQVSLCIRYREEENQPVYSVNHQEGQKEYEHNRIQESYELFLQDTEDIDKPFEVETEFFTGGVLFENQDFRVRFQIPANICAGHYVKAVIEVEKLSGENANLYYEAVMQTPALAAEDGGRELNVLLDNIVLEKGKKLIKEYWLFAQNEELNDTSIVLKSGSAKALINGTDVSSGGSLNWKINIVGDEPEALAARETGKVSMEFRNMGGSTGILRLADMKLVRTESAYLIESVDEKNVKKYVLTMRDAGLRQEYKGYFNKKLPFYQTERAVGSLAAKNEVHKERYEYTQPRMETGIVEIPLGENARRGDICYSSEIMHGLGKGNVYVQVGYESLEEDRVLGKDAKTTVFGDPALFSPTQPAVTAETAVKVLNDKGSFVVALRLLQDVKQLVLTYRWVALRYGGDDLQEEFEETGNQNISAVTPTIVVGTKESYFFQIKYNNMKPCSVSYEMTEPGSGEITSDGIYTAPAKEGVYEIKIYCTDKPLICTYAYAIVKKKVTEAEQDEK